MPRSPDPALVVAALSLVFANPVSADVTARDVAQLPPDSSRLDSQCEHLMLQVLRHANVNFAKSSAQFRTSALAALDEIVEIAFDCPSLMIAVTGHTDATGNDAANRALSKARAESVVTYLAEHGVDPLRLSADGVGSDAPIASNENAAGRQINRRIEFGLRFR